MEDNNSKLVEGLENDDYLHEIIESNRELDNLLLESDFVIETAESELKATIKDIPLASSEDDNISSSLSIEVAEDLFKGFTSDINFSPLRYAEDVTLKIDDSVKIPEELNNLLDDFNASLKAYNTFYKNEINEENLSKLNEDNEETLTADCELNIDNDKTIIVDLQNEQGNLNTKSSLTKKVNIKQLVSIDSEDEHDYLYIDLCNTTLEITVPNESIETVNEQPVISKLQNHNHFEGSSNNFDSKNIGNDYTVVVKTESAATKDYPKTNDASSNCEIIKTDNDFTNDENYGTFQSFDDKITEPCKNKNDEVNLNKLEPNEIPTGNVTYQHCIQSELNNNFTNISEKRVKSQNNAALLNISVVVQNNDNINITKTFTDNSQITVKDNNSTVTQILKRSGEDITIGKTEVKKLKLDEKFATVAKETLKNDKVINIPDHPSSSSTTEINFTQALFDPEETADHNDPKWSALKDLETNEDYFESVRAQWRAISLPNPNLSNTTRYVPESIAKLTPETSTSSENDRVISCEDFLDKRIQSLSHEINTLVAKLNRLSRFKDRNERKKIHNELDHLRNLRHEVEKNKEELKHINMFYYNDAQGWNANYLTKKELSELEQQDKILEYQKTFYKS